MTHLEQLFSVVDGWVKELTRVRPSSIKVSADIVAPIITVYHTIWIKHWYDLENECLSEHLCFLVILLKKEIYCSLYHK